MSGFAPHGADLESASARTGRSRDSLLDASASLAPWTPWALACLSRRAIRVYPDCSQRRLRALLANLHGISADSCLVGNGAAELFTWASRDAAAAGCSLLQEPCFADYSRALSCWGGRFSSYSIPLSISERWPCEFPSPPSSDVLWLCNPHNPSGHLWSRASLTPLLARYQLVICDEAFLPLVPDGEDQSLIPLVAAHPNLVVIRSLTKLYGIAGVRLGYAVAHPERLSRWATWRDPWPVNGFALRIGEKLLCKPSHYRHWCRRVQRWTAREGAWLNRELSAIPGLTPMPSAANFLLLRGDCSLVLMRERLERRHGILLRDCRSFAGLDEHWLRIGYQSRCNNRRIVSAIRREWLNP